MLSSLQRRLLPHCLTGLLLLASLLRAGATGPTPLSTLSAVEIISRAVERSQLRATNHQGPGYVYTKRTLNEELDKKGAVKESKEKVYLATLDHGMTSLRLVELDGKKLSAKELRNQQEREQTERQKLTQSKGSAKGDNRENFLTAELVAKYDFTLVETVLIQGRPSHLLSFKPKSPPLPETQVTDRFLNRITGRIWIDAEEYEIARADLQLLSEITLWGGMLANLKQFDYTLERIRLPQGIWCNLLSSANFEGRKLFDTVKVRTSSHSSGFAPLPDGKLKVMGDR